MKGPFSEGIREGTREGAEWFCVEMISIAVGLMAAALLARHLSIADEFLALIFYLMATALSLAAGWMLKKFPLERREYLNQVCHKWYVLIINGGMGIACIIYLLMSPFQKAVVPLLVLGGSAVIYTLTWALKIIRPHSFWARFRSVIMRMVILTVITGVINGYMYIAMPIIAVPVLIITWRNLRRDQKTAGWPDR